MDELGDIHGDDGEMSAPASRVPHPGAPHPVSVITVPAQLRFLEVIRRAACIELETRGGDADCTRDVLLAVDELASVLILSAQAPSQLRLTVSSDAVEVDVRMDVLLSEAGYHPNIEELTRLLLDATVDIYDIRTNGREVLARLRRRLTRREP
jgi:hypothetical protein